MSERGTGYWWVNQGLTRRRGAMMSLLWAPDQDARGGRQPHWETLGRVEPDDLLLHYAGGWIVGTSVALARAQGVLRPPGFVGGSPADLGRQVLVDYDELERPVPLSAIPAEQRQGASGTGSPFTQLGTVQRGYVFQIDAPLVDLVLRSAGVLDSRSEADDDADDAVDGGTELAWIRETDGRTTATFRREQTGLRRSLFGDARTSRCALCGDSLPVDLLHAAHIKRRADCSNEERNDPSVVMAACTLGCDALYELGYITVNDSGHIHTAPQAPTAAARLDGRRALAHNDTTARYFAWHERTARLLRTTR
ncbi:hypothetical protein ASF48_17750 [Rathayibacter sp. Leaf299]|uniref:HNH endonuclease n=1 Tax=Rathayibacter sp. Leaf299 TaxID=1736328 RepID=UPI0006F2C06D|nr:HNH endonuclease [Rathayibacter sp. Leaf299]KQQ18762.1 hypothetical protein ASF48_17750 [Rathayibacter sp. Leaf299]